MRGSMHEVGEGHWRLRVFAGPRKRQGPSHLSIFQGDQATGAGRSSEVGDRGRTAAGHFGGRRQAWRAARPLARPHNPQSGRLHDRRVHALINKTIKPALGNVRLDRLSARQLDAFYRSLQEKGLSGSSIHQHHSILHASLGRAVKWGLIAANPADRATAPRPARSTATAPEVAEVQKLIAEAEADGDHVLATAIALAAVTGARRGELCALRWSDVDSGRRVLTVSRSLTVLAASATEGPTKTHQRRDIAIDPALASLLAARRGQQESYAGLAGVELVDDAYVLSRSSDGSAPCLPDGLSLAYARLAKRLGIVTHFHELRHFSATTAIAQGVDVRTVAGRLGHADPSLTLRVYAHALEARDRQLADILGRTVLGPVDHGPKLDEADPPSPAELEGTG